jgi:Dolichyl-phosphate-mannose-protein mannosyltransferase
MDQAMTSAAIPAPTGNHRVETMLSGVNPWVYVLAASATLLHFLFNSRYGFFRDELYYAACGEHLAWGYVDHAPLVAMVSRFTRAVLGDSLFALRFFPALAGAAKVFLGGWIAREIGGGKFAQFLAAVTVLVAPIYLTFDNFLSMNAFEPVFWMGCVAVVLRILNGGDRRLWLLCGVIAGLGILNKHSMLFFVSGIVAGLFLTSARRELLNRWFWLGAGIAMLLVLPNLLWEMHRGWPTIALLRTVIGTKYSTVEPWDYIWQQSLLTHPFCAPIWLAGLWFFFADTRGKTYRVLGWAYLVVLAEMLTLHGKIYYMAPAYVMLLAAGCVWLEQQAWLQTKPWRKAAVVTMLFAGGAIAAPLAMPILPVKSAIRYSNFWNVQAVHVENVPQDGLPQLFGDMFGWPEQVEAVAKVYQALPVEDRSGTAILAYNYGEASAIDYFGPRLGLPRATCGHNQYGFWGPDKRPTEVVVAIGFRKAELGKLFSDVLPAANVHSQYALPEERDLTIFVCRKPKLSLLASWPQLKYLD